MEPGAPGEQRSGGARTPRWGGRRRQPASIVAVHGDRRLAQLARTIAQTYIAPKFYADSWRRRSPRYIIARCQSWIPSRANAGNTKLDAGLSRGCGLGRT